MFYKALNRYMDLLQCSGKELSEKSGISEATISRYRTGERVPKADSEELERMCRGICAIAAEKGMDHVLYQPVLKEFRQLIAGEGFHYKSLQTKLNRILSVLSVNVSEMSKALKYDSSYISRVRNGQRNPARPEQFAQSVAEYVARHYDSENEKKIAAQLMNIAPSSLRTHKGYAASLTDWLTDGETADLENPMTKFLEALNAFDLNEYISAIHFDELKVPSVPFQLPTSKSYYGIEEMKNGELDFLKATALSRSKHSVFLCSDMQMDDMAKDLEFSKKYMFGLAAMLKKGLHLQVIHHLNRPFQELMYGLECWIPLYMTGQISPYYLKGIHNQVYNHFLNVSGAAALAGEAIAGHHAKGRYILTKNRTELTYYQERAELLLKKAQPLMEIYCENDAAGLKAFLLADAQTKGARKSILSALPIYTATEDFLHRFLEKRKVTDADRNKILTYAAERKQQIQDILKENTIADEIPDLTREEFDESPLTLSLSILFYDKDLRYSYEEYSEHLDLTRKFAERHPHYSVKQTKDNAFRNIQITMHEGEYVMISKNKSPTIHFVIRHPILKDAIEHLMFPVVSGDMTRKSETSL